MSPIERKYSRRQAWFVFVLCWLLHQLSNFSQDLAIIGLFLIYKEFLKIRLGLNAAGVLGIWTSLVDGLESMNHKQNIRPFSKEENTENKLMASEVHVKTKSAEQISEELLGNVLTAV